MVIGRPPVLARLGFLSPTWPEERKGGASGLDDPGRPRHMAAMPQHDPVPSRRDPRDLERAHRAWLHYRRTMRWMVLASVAAALLAILYLWVTGTEMRLHLVIATLAGVFLSVLLGTGLMGLLFASNLSGADDEATGREHRP
jgi:hypothetical protein